MLVVKKSLFLKNTSVAAALLLSLNSYGMAPTGKSQIAFFKSKNSQFPSGESNYSRLNENILFRAQETVKTENEFYQFGQQKISRSLINPTFAKDLSLTSGYADIGQFMTLNEAYLKDKADVQSNSIHKIAENTKLIPLKFENGFVQVMHKGKKGYVDISNCISKFDYAYAVYAEHSKTKQKQWHYVKSRLFDQIEIYDGSHISMSKIEGLFTNNKMAIITNKISKLPLWSRVTLKAQTEIGSQQMARWNQSFLSGHGLVWWQYKEASDSRDEVLKMDDILKKEVYSISTHPNEPRKSIISIADGVYITEDGLNWRPITQFKSYKGPVYYYNDNLIFVGSYRSTDHAKSFEQFINVQSISSLIKNKIGYNPPSVKIKRIKSNAPSQITIDVDTGFKVLQLQTMIYNQSWEIVKR